MKKNTITFSENGKSFTIKFVTGSESLEINSKEEGFKSITKLAKENKISTEEFVEMREQILGAEKLPWSDIRKEKISIGKILGVALIAGLIDSMLNEDADDDEKVAQFKMCECDRHGKIYAYTDDSRITTNDLWSKKSAFAALEDMKKRDYLNEEEFKKVKNEIEASTLLEDVHSEVDAEA